MSAWTRLPKPSIVGAISITVHHLNYSRPLRVLWLLEELGLEFGIKHWQRDSRPG